MALKNLIILLLITASAACSNSTGGRTTLYGTSDTGGGNGIENKAYEAYIVNVDQLPAYIQLIEPKIQRLLALAPNGNLAHSILKRWLLYKTWYIAPISLDTISKDVIGVSFSTDQTEQLALQTKKSIWINSQRFNQMSNRDQATLIIHEMVMSLYYLRYKSWEEICTENIYPDIKCDPNELDLLNELFPGTEPKPFNSEDYENIRAVTGAFLNDFPFKSPQELDQFLMANKFDRRFTFGLGLDDSGKRQRVIFSNGEKIPVETLSHALETAKMLNQLPDQCRGVRFNSPIDCSFNFAKSKRRFRNTYEFPVLEVTTMSHDRNTSFGFSNTLNLTDSNIEGSSIEFVDQKKKLFYWLLNPDPFPTHLSSGVMFRSMVLVTVQDLALKLPSHTLLGVQSIPGVITGKNSQDPDECTFAKPSAKSIMDDVIIAQSRHLSEFDKALLATRASSMPPFTTCRL